MYGHAKVIEHLLRYGFSTGDSAEDTPARTLALTMRAREECADEQRHEKWQTRETQLQQDLAYFKARELRREVRYNRIQYDDLS